DEAVQRRVYDEAMAVIGHGAVEGDHIDALSFTRQVILEAMRLFPPIPLLSRMPKTVTQLGGLAITPPAWVAIPIFALHRNPLPLIRSVSRRARRMGDRGMRIFHSAPGRACALAQTSP